RGARLGFVDRRLHQHACAIALDRTVGVGEVGGARVLKQAAQNFVTMFAVADRAIERAGALFELGLAGGRLGAGLVEPALILGALTLDLGGRGVLLRRLQDGVGRRVHAPAGETHRAEREQSLLAR